MNESPNNNFLWDMLKAHFGHRVVIALYGDIKDPANICLEDETTNEVVLDAGLYTVCPRTDSETDGMARHTELPDNTADDTKQTDVKDASPKENVPYRGCKTCKYWDKRTYGGEVPNGYCVEDGDQVYLSELKQFCWAWKERR